MPVTIHQLVEYRLGKSGSLTGLDYESAGLQILGGCQVCGATLAGYNACPSKSGYWRCLNWCIADDGWDDVRQADADIFGAYAVEWDVPPSE